MSKSIVGRVSLGGRYRLGRFYTAPNLMDNFWGFSLLIKSQDRWVRAVRNPYYGYVCHNRMQYIAVVIKHPPVFHAHQVFPSSKPFRLFHLKVLEDLVRPIMRYFPIQMLAVPKVKLQDMKIPLCICICVELHTCLTSIACKALRNSCMR